MKQKITTAGTLLLLGFFFLHPQEALAASQDGMKLWLNTILPTLLPFLILTDLLLHTGRLEMLLAPLRPFWAKIFGLSPCGAYALILGLLCGYPMGARLTSELYQAGKIGRQEAQYLLTFINNASPAFLSAYLGGVCLGNSIKTSRIFLILLISDAVCMLFFRYTIYKNNTITPVLQFKKETSVSAPSSGAGIDVSIMNSFEIITRLGGYILMFSILAACISHYWPFSPILKYLVLGSTELTTGLNQLALSGLPFEIRFLLSMMMTAFGGLCIMLQIRSVLDKDLSILSCLMAKCLNTVLTGLLVLTEIV